MDDDTLIFSYGYKLNSKSNSLVPSCFNYLFLFEHMVAYETLFYFPS